MLGGLELSPFFAVLAFGLAIAVAAAFFTDRLRLPVEPATGYAGSTRQVLTSPLSLVAWPLVLLLAAFAVSGATNLLWVLVVGALVLGLGVQALGLLRRVHRARGDAHVSGPTVATVAALLTLLEFHWLTVVRLAVVPDPAAPLPAGLAGSALEAGGKGLLLPAAGLAALLAVVSGGDRVRNLLDALPRPPSWLRRYGPPVAVFLLFVLPAVPVLGDSGRLTFLGVATPEYGKIAYLWLLALIVAKHVVSAGTTRQGPWYRNKRVAYPAGLFLLVAVASVVRSDLGPLIPVFVGTLAMSWCALRDEAARRVPPGPPSEQRRAAEREARTVFRRDLTIPLVVIAIFAGAALATDYVQVRLEVRNDAWQYNWNVICDPPAADLPLPADIPQGAGACLRNLQSAEASNRSQVAKAGAAIADGGVWGRGLADTASARIPLAATDFALAAVWSKLGGLVVLGFGLLLALLAAALNRAVWHRRRTVPRTSTLLPPADRSRLFAAGVSATILGQFAFVLAATLNWLPHSGITVPLLSRGGQSTLALAGGVVIALAVVYRDSAPPAATWGAKRTATGPAPVRPGLRGSGAVALFVVAALVVPILRPYGGHPENLPVCGPATAIVDADRCSTDLIAYGRTSLELHLTDGRALTRSQNQGTWTWEGTGTPETTGLGGLVTAPGGGQGLAEAALPNVLRSARPTSPVSRLLPHVADGSSDGFAALTVEPTLQVAATDALAAAPAKPGVPVLAGGLVLLDAKTGHLLAAASAPRTVPGPPGPPVTITTDQSREFQKEHGYGPVRPDGSFAEPPPETTDRSCAVAARITENNPACNRWFLTDRPAATLAKQRVENDRYVGGGPGVTVDPVVRRPDPAVNRALGRGYGLGSTFKVVVAAAFLRGDPTAGPQTLIDAPPKVPVGNGVVVRNYGDNDADPAAPGHSCPGTTPSDTITLQDALAVSCNTAFVALAQRIGWDAVRDAATDFGFGIGGGPDQPAPLAGSCLDPVSVVPRAAAGSAIGNVALGGGDIQGTPLQMASVMATIANSGHRIQPSIATEVRAPGGPTEQVRPTESDPFSPAVADKLKKALEKTTTGCKGCTAAHLTPPPGKQLWVKTGTHVVYANVPVPRSAYAVEYAWIAGFMDTKAGPVAFTIALEAGKGDGSGAARSREVLMNVLNVVAKERG